MRRMHEKKRLSMMLQSAAKIMLSHIFHKILLDLVKVMKLVKSLIHKLIILVRRQERIDKALDCRSCAYSRDCADRFSAFFIRGVDHRDVPSETEAKKKEVFSVYIMKSLQERDR